MLFHAFSRWGASAFAALLAGSLSAGQDLRYKVLELRDPNVAPSLDSYGNAIDIHGNVAGKSFSSTSSADPFVWNERDGFTVVRGGLAPNSGATSISGGGNLSGTAVLGNTRRAFAWIQGRYYDIGAGEAYGVNRKGLVVGQLQSNGRAFLWSPEGFVQLGSLPSCPLSLATAINEADTVVGYCVGSGIRGFKWAEGVMQDLGTHPNFPYGSQAYGVNYRGDIAGVIFQTAIVQRAAVHKDGQWINIGSLYAGHNTFAYGLNDLTQVVGMDGLYQQPIFWSEATGLRGLRNYISNWGSWTAMTCQSINNKGWIVGTGLVQYAAGKQRFSAFVLLPTEIEVEPESLRVRLGRVLAGDLDSLQDIDGDVLRVARYVVPNQTVAPVTFDVEATLPATPMNLWAQTYGRMATQGSFEQTLSFFDWGLNQFDTTDAGRGEISVSQMSLETVARGDIGRFVRSSDRAVRARIEVKATGPTANPLWESEHDFVGFRMVPRD
ncbi:MAG: hypothetical protein KF884_04245 [Fimbriimonadaceae bacterium]|nr:hypothetical protein [Fimbriimonadaceae bacterium]QYK59300.1 MAG: hypothetical protein KF884_04245 [Fimbriimonadaceae bacterium]